jgi:predicted transcriptional regulator
MDRLWAWGGTSTVREMLDDLTREREIAYTTVMTVMDNLHRKELVTRKLDGRAYRYSAVGTRSDHAAELIAEVLGGSEDRTAPLLRFVERLSAEEVSRLRASLDVRELDGREPGGQAPARGPAGRR